MGEIKGGTIKHCPICGCTEHRLIGCHTHKLKHKKGPDGRCIVAEKNAGE